MLNTLPKRRQRAAYVARVACHIDNGVELHASDRREAVRLVSIYTDKPGARRNRSGSTSRSAGNVVARCKGVGGNCSP
jgi:hypothetical protein